VRGSLCERRDALDAHVIKQTKKEIIAACLFNQLSLVNSYHLPSKVGVEVAGPGVGLDQVEHFVHFVEERMQQMRVVERALSLLQRLRTMY